MQKILIMLILAICISGCQPASLDDVSSPALASTPHESPTDPVETATAIPAQETLSQPALESPVTNVPADTRESDQMPIFLEVTQTTIMKTDSIQGPTIGVGPTVYFYNPDSKTLMLHSTITLVPATELLVGVNTVLQTPGQVYEKRALFQYPSAQPALIQISAFDAETGMLNLVYDGEAFNLLPGESRTFKQVGSDFNTSTVFTIVSNHGILADIQPTSSDGSWR